MQCLRDTTITSKTKTMANNCYNWIQMYGDNLNDVNKMIDEAVKRNDEGYGWLPTEREFNLNYVHYLFDIQDYDKGDDESRMMCWTKWSPPIEELKIISTMHPGVEFHMQWEECGFQLYGRCVVKDGVVVHYIDLTDDELNSVVYDDDMDEYVWRKDDGTSVIVDYESEVYEELLDKKQKW